MAHLYQSETDDMDRNARHRFIPVPTNVKTDIGI